MPAALVSRLGQRNELSEIKTVPNDAVSRVMRAVDAEAMTHELMSADRLTSAVNLRRREGGKILSA